MTIDTMRSFDRPIRPEWIYKLHHIWQSNQLSSDYNQFFDDLAWQVEGVDARRKARNVLFHYFLTTEGKGRTKKTVTKDTLVSLSQSYSLEQMKPLYLAILLGNSEIIQKITEVIAKRYQQREVIDVAQISQLMKREYGDRDVIRRSVTSFCKTLHYFGLFDITDKVSTYSFSTKLLVDFEIAPFLLYQLFAIRLRRLQFDLTEMQNDYCWLYFDMPNVEEMQTYFNNEFWTISKKVGFERLTFLHSEWSEIGNR